jgi:hypothetical protein
MRMAKKLSCAIKWTLWQVSDAVEILWAKMVQLSFFYSNLPLSLNGWVGWAIVPLADDNIEREKEEKEKLSRPHSMIFNLIRKRL